MKKLYFLAFIILASCTGNHYHDGLYVKGLGANNMSNEVLRINGNEITDAKYSYGGELKGETKVVCTQFADRIEFTENGIIKIMRITDSGSLKLSDNAVFVRYAKFDDSFTIKEIKTEPLVKQVGDKFILLGKKSNEVSETKGSSSKTLKEYPYSISENDKYFTYCNDSLKKCYLVVVSQSDVEISEYGCDTAFLTGDFDAEGNIIDDRKDVDIHKGIKTNFKMINNILYVSYHDKKYYKFISKSDEEKKDAEKNE